MSLQEELAKMKAQQEQESAAPVEEEKPEPVEEPEAPEPAVDEKSEEPAEGDVVEPTPAPEDKKAYNDAMAKMRRELAATKRMLEEAKAQPKPVAQPVPQAAAPAIDEEPDVNTNPVEWVQWNIQKTEAQVKEIREWKEEQARTAQQTQVLQSAVQELSRYENEFKAIAPDYDDVSNFVVGELKRSFKIMHPGASDDQITQAVQRHVLLEASRYAQQGLNPVEEMYLRAKNELGYQPKAPTDEKVVELRPDLDKIAKNKARSAGMNGAAGAAQRAAPSTKAAAADMTAAEWAKLSEEDRRRILSMH